MLECSKCGKTSLNHIIRCELVRTGLCQFETETRRYVGHRRQAWLILLLALAFIFLIIVYPILPGSVAEGSAFYGLVYSLILGLFLFAGIAAFVVGLLLLFARQVISVSQVNGQSCQENILWTRSYRTRVVQIIDVQQFVGSKNLTLPGSIVAVGKNDHSTNSIQQQNLASRVFLAALFDLLNRRLVIVKQAQIYQADGQQIEHSEERLEYLLFPGTENISTTFCGALEKQLFDVITNWKKYDNWLDCPLAPRISDLLLAVVAAIQLPGNQLPSMAIIECVQNDPLLKQAPLLEQERVNNLSIMNQLFADNEKLFNEFERVVVLMLDAKHIRSKIKKVITLSNPRFSRYLRNGLIVSIILIFTSSRWLLGVDIFSDTSKSFFKEHRVQERSQAIVLDSKTQAHSKFWQWIRWFDYQLAQLEYWYKTSRFDARSVTHQLQKVKRLISDGTNDSRRQAIALLSTMELQAEQLIELFRALINDADEQTRQAALQALLQHDDIGIELIPDMVDLLDSDKLTADLAADNLTQLAEKHSLEIERNLQQALKKHDRELQDRVRKLLAELKL